MSFLRLFLLLFVVVVLGCTISKKAETPDESVGLDTIPFYRKGDLGFSTGAALKRLEMERAEEERRKAGAIEDVKKRVGEGEEGLGDPTVPPATRGPTDLPAALRGFPKDTFGYPDWTAAVKKGLIKPKGTLLGGKEEEADFSADIVFVINDRFMADVIFPHMVHTYWLSCNNCHPSIFKPKRGANEFNMDDIWKGEYCGRCHGKVAFQPKGFENCQRCHSEKKR